MKGTILPFTFFALLPGILLLNSCHTAHDKPIAGDSTHSVSTISVYNEYFLTPAVDSLRPPYTGIYSHPLPGAVRSKMMELIARKILAKTSSGDSIRNYYIREIKRKFSPYESIDGTENYSNGEFSEDPSLIGANDPDHSVPSKWVFKPFRFRDKNGKADDGSVVAGTDYHFTTRLYTVPATYPYKVVKAGSLNPDSADLFFAEKWIFDPESGRFSKEIKYNGFFRRDAVSNDGTFYQGLGACLENDAPGNLDAGDSLLAKNVIDEVAIDNDDIALLSDMSLSKDKHAAWNALYKLDCPYGNIPGYPRSEFLAALFYYAFHHPGNVFPVKNGEPDSLHPFTSAAGIRALYYQVDTTNEVEDPVHPGKFIPSPISRSVLLQEIYAVRFYEDWYCDPKTFSIKKKVKGIGFILCEPGYFDQSSNTMVDSGIYIKLN